MITFFKGFLGLMSISKKADKISWGLNNFDKLIMINVKRYTGAKKITRYLSVANIRAE